jgi:hypothetical protein
MSETENPATPVGMPRRVALRVIGAGVPAAAFAAGGAEAGQEAAAGGVAAEAAPTSAGGYAFQFLTGEEQATARLLADLIIPADQTSGSASEAGAVEYMDEYAVFWGEPVQVQLRGGLLWLDRECRRRFDRAFAGCDDAQRRSVLDDIAYPERLPPAVARAAEASVAQPEVPGVAAVRPGAEPLDPEQERLRHGVAFFILFRNLVQGGFYSSRIGTEDLGFQGNVPTDWNGCPPDVLKKIGVTV